MESYITKLSFPAAKGCLSEVLEMGRYRLRVDHLSSEIAHCFSDRNGAHNLVKGYVSRLERQRGVNGSSKMTPAKQEVLDELEGLLSSQRQMYERRVATGTPHMLGPLEHEVEQDDRYVGPAVPRFGGRWKGHMPIIQVDTNLIW
jgi:hypothetical protein